MNVLVEETSLQDIANAIREKNGSADTYKPSQMADAVRGIENGGFSYDEIATNDVTGDVILSVDKVAYNAFKSKKITSVVGENVTSLGDECFYGSTIIFAEFKNNTSNIPNSSFRNCKALKKVDCGYAKKIIAFAFHSDNVLDTLILRSATVCTIDNTNAFDGTCFAVGKTGGIAYVPSSLVESYKIATNWSLFYENGTCEFRAIEGSEYE